MPRTSATANHLIVVRSLKDSDLGLFAAHRSHTASKQRALNINAPIAQQMLSGVLYVIGKTDLECICTFQGIQEVSKRHFGKVGKNWRLGGKKLEGDTFLSVNSCDFALIRSVNGNDGNSPIYLTFVTRKMDQNDHIDVAEKIGTRLDQSMAVFTQGTEEFSMLERFFPPIGLADSSTSQDSLQNTVKQIPVPPMPWNAPSQGSTRKTMRERVRSPHILEHMFKVSGDLSASQQFEFMETLEQLASQLRILLLETGHIIKLERDHTAVWRALAGQPIGFVDGGLANLSSLGSAPIAARVGGYVVIPGDKTENREHFIVLKQLIDELFTAEESGVYRGGFPDIGALRDAARISLETAGAVRLITEYPKIKWLFSHGSLVNPVSRYTDVMENNQATYRFPNFSSKAISELLSDQEACREGRNANFISVYLEQLQILNSVDAIVCGVVERESTSTTVCRTLLNHLNDDQIRSLLPYPPAEWREVFIEGIELFRISDALLFRCVLEPGEVVLPVPINRNELRRAPEAWKDIIANYPKPWAAYMLPTEWGHPFRIEIFEKDRSRFPEIAKVLMHCALLLPHYAFPVGLDIVDKFAHVPNWMSRPVNTHTIVQTMKRALDSGDSKMFDALRRLLCGSSRDWFLRPKP